MPRRGSVTPLDLVGKLDVVRINCDRCDRRDRYRISEIIRAIGLDGMLADWFAGVKRDCPRQRDFSDPCGATTCPDFAHLR